jgi:hypothetical protein
MHCRVEDPVQYLKVIASVLPREMVFETALEDVSDEDLDRMIITLRHKQPPPMLIEAKPEKVTNGRKD